MSASPQNSACVIGKRSESTAVQHFSIIDRYLGDGQNNVYPQQALFLNSHLFRVLKRGRRFHEGHIEPRHYSSNKRDFGERHDGRWSEGCEMSA